MSVIAACAQWTTNNYGSQMGHDSRAVECSVAGEDRTANRLSALRRLGHRRTGDAWDGIWRDPRISERRAYQALDKCDKSRQRVSARHSMQALI